MSVLVSMSVAVLVLAVDEGSSVEAVLASGMAEATGATSAAAVCAARDHTHPGACPPAPTVEAAAEAEVDSTAASV